jgi:tetratricopeptide (TPR) repeat protein
MKIKENIRVVLFRKGWKPVVFLFILLNCRSAFSESTRSLFQNANAYYKSKQYEEAEHFYLQVLKRDKNNVSAAYNLGNTYYHLAKYPEAVLYYEKARKLQPDNKYILQNLALTNNKLFTKIEFSKEFFVAKISRNLFNSRSSNQWSVYMLVCLWLSVLLLIIYFFTQNRLARKSGFFFLFITLLLGYFTYSRSKEEKVSQYAIVFNDNSHLQKAPVDASPVIDSIDIGLKVKMLDKDAGWLKVELPTGKSGWIKNNQVELI